MEFIVIKRYKHRCGTKDIQLVYQHACQYGEKNREQVQRTEETIIPSKTWKGLERKSEEVAKKRPRSLWRYTSSSISFLLCCVTSDVKRDVRHVITPELLIRLLISQKLKRRPCRFCKSQMLPSDWSRATFNDMHYFLVGYCPVERI